MVNEEKYIGEYFVHKKRNTSYKIIGEGTLKFSTKPELDDTEMIIYKGFDEKVWIRPKTEFFDGRFRKGKIL